MENLGIDARILKLVFNRMWGCGLDISGYGSPGGFCKEPLFANIGRKFLDQYIYRELLFIGSVAYMVAQFEDVSKNTYSLYVSTPDSSNLLAQNTLT
jgi:hypothetical protein